MAAAKKDAVKVKLIRSVARRVAGVKAICKADSRVRRFVAMHGFNTETKAADLDTDGQPTAPGCFASQMAAAVAWIEERGGGLLCGDFNRVLCTQWRRGPHRLTSDDRRVRSAAWHDCGCCSRDDDPSVRGLEAALVGGGGEFTRWDTTTDGSGCRRWGAPSARIDYAIAFGGEAHAWR